MEKWKKVDWSDESRFLLHNVNGQMFCTGTIKKYNLFHELCQKKIIKVMMLGRGSGKNENRRVINPLTLYDDISIMEHGYLTLHDVYIFVMVSRGYLCCTRGISVRSLADTAGLLPQLQGLEITLMLAV